MYICEALQQKSLCAFILLSTVGSGMCATCSAQACSATGVVLLLLNSTVTKASSGLAFDSDDEYNEPHWLDLELVGDEDHALDALTSYVHSKGYREQDDVSYMPDVWNSAPEIRASHNCYMYALNDFSPRSGKRCNRTRSLIQRGKLRATQDASKVCKPYFHKPGYYFQNIVSGRAETDIWYRNETTCNLMLPMIAADSPSILWKNGDNETLQEADACPKFFYMAALFIQPKAGFHFYRRDHPCPTDANERCWSHKPGVLEATNKDASGSTIMSVLQADRNYGELSYSEHCAFFCVPQNSRERTHSDSRRSQKRKHHLRVGATTS